MSWRSRARSIIADVIHRVGTSDPKALRAALREAYPFGERKNHPYKIWCHEVRLQLGLVKVPDRTRSAPASCEGQLDLFEGVNDQ